MSKKGGKAQSKEQSYEIRDVVLAKVRGYPPWPGIIVDPESVPKNVQGERPNAKSKKGNWYCVRFFPAGDYAWMVPKDISKLQQHEIQAYINEPYKRSGDLLQGYKIALDPTKWEEERDALQAEAAEEEANAEVDQLESDAAEEEEEEETDKKPKTKKRKRESEVASAKAKPKSKSKKEPAEPKKKPATASKAKKNGVKSKALVESEDEAAAEGEDEEEEEDAGPSKKASPPPAKKQKRDKDEEEADSALNNDPEATKVRDWRHKLQKAFLGKQAPKEEDVTALDALFNTVESYDNMTIQYLTFSKIGKVMRHIHALPTEKVPRDDELKFRERAKTLVDKWHDILNASKTNGDGTLRKPAANGKAHSEEAGAKSANGKEASLSQEPALPEKTEKKESDAMEVDVAEKNEEKKEEITSEAPATEAEADAPAEAEADDAPPEAATEPLKSEDVAMTDAA